MSNLRVEEATQVDGAARERLEQVTVRGLRLRRNEHAAKKVHEGARRALRPQQLAARAVLPLERGGERPRPRRRAHPQRAVALCAWRAAQAVRESVRRGRSHAPW